MLAKDDPRRGIQILETRLAEVKAINIHAYPDQEFESHLRALSIKIQNSLRQVFGSYSMEYKSFLEAADLETEPDASRIQKIAGQARSSIQNRRTHAMEILRAAIDLLRERAVNDITDPAPARSLRSPEGSEMPTNRKIFIVHGQDEVVKLSVHRFLMEAEFEPVILAERTNGGRTIIEKFEKEADVGFAIILLTPDDEGALKGQPARPRARQNVILELGYFIGRLGRHRICALRKADVEVPSDILGVVWTEFDAGGAWKQALGKELQSAGYAIDWNKIMGS